MIDEEVFRYLTLIKDYYYRLGRPVPDEAVDLLNKLIPYELDFKTTWSGVSSLLMRLDYLNPDELNMLIQFMIENYQTEKNYIARGEIRVGNNNPITSINYSPSGKTLACSSGDNKVYLLDMEEQITTHTFENKFGGIGEISLSKEHLAYLNLNNQVIVWDFPSLTLHKIFTGNHYAISSEDYCIIVSHADGTIISYLLASGLEMGRVQFSHDPATKVVSSKFSYIATSHLAKIILWDPVLNLIGYLDGHENKVTELEFHNKKRVMASGSLDCDIILWDLDSKNKKLTLTGHSGSIKCLAFSPNEDILASGYEDNKIIFWDTNTGKIINKFQGELQSISCLSFTPDGRSITSGHTDGTIKFWGEINDLK